MLSPDDDENEFEKVNAIIRIELGLDPDTLTDKQWAKMYQEWNFVNKTKLKATELIIEKVVRQALADTLKAIYGK